MALIINNATIEQKLQYSQVITPPLIWPLSSGNLTLNANTEYAIFVTGSGSSIQVNLGNATTYLAGRTFHLFNSSDQTLSVRNNAGTELFTMYRGASSIIKLQDNSTANGIWGFNVSSSGSFTGTAPVICSYSAGATSGRYLEFFPSNSSDTSPYYIVTDSLLVAMSVVSTSSSTGTVSLFKTTDLVNPIASISLAAQTTNSSIAYNVSLNAGDSLAVRLTSGSIQKPGVALYLTSV
jgi:hypothetical protein